MKTVTIQDAEGRLVSVPVSDALYGELEVAKRADETKRRIDRARLVQEELSDYHTHILMCPERLMSEEVQEKLLIEQMLRCLSMLSDYEQLLVHKRFFEGLSYAGIASDVGVSPQAIHQRLSHIIKTLSMMMGLN